MVESRTRSAQGEAGGGSHGVRFSKNHGLNRAVTAPGVSRLRQVSQAQERGNREINNGNAYYRRKGSEEREVGDSAGGRSKEATNREDGENETDELKALLDEGYLPNCQLRLPSIERLTPPGLDPALVIKCQEARLKVARARGKSLIGGSLHSPGGAAHRTPVEPSQRNIQSVSLTHKDDRPFDIHPLELLQDVRKKMRLPKGCGYRTFKSMLISPVACDILTCAFWWIFCKFYQLGSEDIQEDIVDDLAALYVELMLSLECSHDRSMEYFPFAISYAICTRFHRDFPAARHTRLFDDAFRNRVYKEVSELFSGVSTNAEDMPDHRKRLGLNTDDLDMSSDEEDDDIFEQNSAEGDDSNLQALPKLKMERAPLKPLRERVDAVAISPLMKRYITCQHWESGFHRPWLLRRTVSRSGCSIGGERTFKRTPVRYEKQHAIFKRWLEAKKEAAALGREMKTILSEELDLIQGERDQMLQGGLLQMEHFIEAPAGERYRQTLLREKRITMRKRAQPPTA